MVNKTAWLGLHIDANITVCILKLYLLLSLGDLWDAHMRSKNTIKLQ